MKFVAPALRHAVLGCRGHNISRTVDSSQTGFGYHEVTRDTASHIFSDTLPAGSHVFESSVRVQHAGIYQTGIAELRCMYAPEFNAHSASVMLEVVRCYGCSLVKG